MDIQYYKQYEPIFGVWRINRLIGEGSFGKVFEIEREDFGVTYKAALKAITIPANESELRAVLADGLDEAGARDYFGSLVADLVQEFAFMNKLKGNTNVVGYENHQVIEHKNSIGWDILIQMELLTPLNDYVKARPITRQDVIKLGIDICKALQLCQRYHIIHRDVKPENIFVSETGDFKLGDFGIARTAEKTTSGLSKKGTYAYMAPEIYRGNAYGSTVDIYSLGIVLYRLLNDSRTPFLPPYPAPITHSDRELALAKRFGGLPLPLPKNAPDYLGQIVLKACAYDPAARYATPLQMQQDLEAVLYGHNENLSIHPNQEEIPQPSLHNIPTQEPSVSPKAAEQTVGMFDVGRQPSSNVAEQTVGAWNIPYTQTTPPQPAPFYYQNAPQPQPAKSKINVTHLIVKSVLLVVPLLFVLSASFMALDSLMVVISAGCIPLAAASVAEIPYTFMKRFRLPLWIILYFIWGFVDLILLTPYDDFALLTMSVIYFIIPFLICALAKLIKFLVGKANQT